MSKLEMTPAPESVGKPQTIRVDLTKKSVQADISRTTYTDKDTNQIVHYIPAFDISAYGETEEKADEMLKVVAEDLFTHLLSLSYKNLQTELREMGFKQTLMKNKEFSKVVIDENGQLQNFNAVENSIRRSNLSFAA